MVCKKCGNDYSIKVWHVHKERCNGVQKKQTEAKAEATEAVDLSALSKEELMDYADEMGVEIDRRWGAPRIIDAINGD